METKGNISNPKKLHAPAHEKKNMLFTVQRTSFNDVQVERMASGSGAD